MFNTKMEPTPKDGLETKKLPAILTPEQKKKYLDCLLAGLAHVDILYRINSTPAIYKATREHEPNFAKAIAYIKKNRPKQIESSLYKYATGKCKISKKTYAAILDDFGDPKLDANGRQMFYCKQKEVTTIPPNPSLIMYYLKQKAMANGEEVNENLTPDQLVAELEKLMKNG